ncbi:outer membrane beta-barrel protein [Vibrio campbellii]|uniref:outer membrane beta-barrel protein n=1 Tax=Vibrio campbellii TaxID=680 RepID=UPI0001543424|nr:outer membrane beta-barrel protein [Vibrio campbellii]EDL69220.1 LysM domain protein [Vibrio campbellii HY01]APX06401.1 peptidoglycan-binding protein LysM [Vibrio campbellii]ARR06582.1 peptidoglycan-binding protein LysM [Vibrio campbellii]MCC8256025.1 outer membrane beta-barrel protein [Vibrio campbellii CAIM 333]HDM8216333.1 outer membrane beta-barrel protein [Vibrio campbellii]
MKQYYLLALMTLTPSLALAEETAVASPYYVKGGLNASVLDDRKKDGEGFGFEVMAGFIYKHDIFLEAGYQGFDWLRDDNIELNALTLKANWLMPVSDFAAIYAGPGVAYIESDVSPTAQLGLQYQLSTNWYADVGYQGIFDIDGLDDDLYSFNVSFLYRFDNETKALKEEKVDLPEPPVVEEPAETVPDHIECNLESYPYRLVKGDYLLKIARANNLTLRDIIQLNPQLKGRNLDLVYPGELINYPRTVCK